MQHPRAALGQRRRVAPGGHPLAAGLQADQAHLGVVEEGVEDADRVGAATHARRDGVGQPAGDLQHLGAGLHPDHSVEVADHHREGVGSGHGPQQVVGGGDVGDPVPHRLVDGVLQGAAPGAHRDHLGPQQAHPGHVERLPAGVDLPHVDDALQPEQGGGGRGGHPVLAGPGLGDDPRLAHPSGEQRLPQHVVDLVGPGVVEVLPLEQDPSRPGVAGEPRGLRERGGPAAVGGEQPVQFGLERRVQRGGPVGGVELLQRRHECLGHEAPAVRPESAGSEPGAHRCCRECLMAGWAPAVTSSATAARGLATVTRLSPTSTASAPALA